MNNKEAEVIEEIKDSNSINLPTIQTTNITIDNFKADIELQKKMFEVLKDYVKSQLVAGVDYYSVKKKAKPSLGQPGAEKINYLFHLIPKPILEEKIFTLQEVRYEYTVELYNKDTQKFAGSGVGCCSSMEDKYRYYWDENGNKHEIDNHINIANTIKKMAYKRAYVDACVKNTMASFLFTQDLEDLPDYYIGKDSKTSIKNSTSFKSNREYWNGYDWSKVDLNKVPPSRGYDKAKKKPQSSTEALKLYFYACDVMPKENVPDYLFKLTGKKTYQNTYGDIKTAVKALTEIEDGDKDINTKLDEEFPIEEG